MDINELNQQLLLAVPDLKPGYLVRKRIGNGGICEGVYMCRNPRIVLKLQSNLREFAKLYEAGALNNSLFPRVYRIVTDHPLYSDPCYGAGRGPFPYNLLWREMCYMPPLKYAEGMYRGYRYQDFRTDDDRLVNEARRIVAAGLEQQSDRSMVTREYKLPEPWAITPPAELVHVRQAVQDLAEHPTYRPMFDDSSMDIHLKNFGFVYRGRGKKRTRRVVLFDPVVY